MMLNDYLVKKGMKMDSTVSFVEAVMNKTPNFTDNFQKVMPQSTGQLGFSNQTLADDLSAVLAGNQGLDFNLSNTGMDSNYQNEPSCDFNLSSPPNDYCYNQNQNQKDCDVWYDQNNCFNQSNFVDPNFMRQQVQEDYLKMCNQETDPQLIFQLDQEDRNKEYQQQLLLNWLKQICPNPPQHQNNMNNMNMSNPPSPCYSQSIPSPTPSYRNLQSPQSPNGSMSPQYQSNYQSSINQPGYSNFPNQNQMMCGLNLPSPNPSLTSKSNYSHSIPSPQSTGSLGSPIHSNSDDDEILDDQMLINTFKTLAEYVNNPNIQTPVNPREKIKPKRKRVRKGTRNPAGKPRLYNFLHEILDDPAHYSCIEWVDKSTGLFKFLDSAQVARLWGFRKNKPLMKYENFARSLRTYIAKGILTKPRNKLVYCFAKPPPIKPTAE